MFAEENSPVDCFRRRGNERMRGDRCVASENSHHPLQKRSYTLRYGFSFYFRVTRISLFEDIRVFYFRAYKISFAEDKTKSGLSGEEFKISSVVSPLITKTLTHPAFMPLLISV